jgi:hypothetical protein
MPSVAVADRRPPLLELDQGQERHQVLPLGWPVHHHVDPEGHGLEPLPAAGILPDRSTARRQQQT